MRERSLILLSGTRSRWKPRSGGTSGKLGRLEQESSRRLTSEETDLDCQIADGDSEEDTRHRINDPEDGPEEESEDETRSRESEECDEEEIERRRSVDRQETLNAFPSKPMSTNTKPGQKSQSGCYRHFSGSCELGDKCEYSHSDAAMKKICSDALEKGAKYQHISLAEQHKLLDQFATKKHPDTGLPTRIFSRGEKRA